MLKEKKFSMRRFGVELEVGNAVPQDVVVDYILEASERPVEITEWGQSTNNLYWHVKEDATCGVLSGHFGLPTSVRTYGTEIASFVGSGIHDLIEIMNVANHLSKSGVKVNDFCGFHIHVDVSDFTDEQVAVLLARWVKIEFLMTNTVPERRVNNKYCKMLSKSHRYKSSASYTAAEFWRLMKPVNLRLKSFFDRFRRVTLNIVNYVQACDHLAAGGDELLVKKTVELRLPEGTLNSEDIANWVKLFVNFVDSSLGCDMPPNMRSVMQLHKMLEYLGLQTNATLSPGLTKTREWLLKRMVQYGKEKWQKNASKLLKSINETI